jgi:hypothetical protein
MNPACDICQFLGNKPLKNQILTTNYWTVGVIPDQPYLGRALITLLTHKGSLGQLSDEQALGAKPLNIGCFMNHGYRDDPPHPHVHWQLFPRYKDPVELKGITFQDDRYGEFYDNDAQNLVGDEVVEEIVNKLRAALGSPNFG